MVAINLSDATLAEINRHRREKSMPSLSSEQARHAYKARRMKIRRSEDNEEKFMAFMTSYVVEYDLEQVNRQRRARSLPVLTHAQASRAYAAAPASVINSPKDNALFLYLAMQTVASIAVADSFSSGSGGDSGGGGASGSWDSGSSDSGNNGGGFSE